MKSKLQQLLSICYSLNVPTLMQVICTTLVNYTTSLSKQQETFTPDIAENIF